MNTLGKKLFTIGIPILIGLILGTLGVSALSLQLRHASHDRNWEIGQEKLPHIAIDGDTVHIKNMRDFVWAENKSEIQKKYTTRDFLLSDIEGIDVVVSHFSPREGIAHVLLNFRIKDQD